MQDEVITTEISWVRVSEPIDFEHLLRYMTQELTSPIVSTKREPIPSCQPGKYYCQAATDYIENQMVPTILKTSHGDNYYENECNSM